MTPSMLAQVTQVKGRLSFGWRMPKKHRQICYQASVSDESCGAVDQVVMFT